MFALEKTVENIPVILSVKGGEELMIGQMHAPFFQKHVPSFIV